MLDMTSTRLLAYLVIPALAFVVSTMTVVWTSPSGPTQALGAVAAFPVTLQLTDNDCGLAAIATLARLGGVDLPDYGDLVSRYHSRRYQSMEDLRRIAADFGVRLKPVRVSEAGLRLIPLPAIIHFRSKHFVVLITRSESLWHIANPAVGVQRLRPEVFESMVSGMAVVVEKDDLADPEGHERR